MKLNTTKTKHKKYTILHVTFTLSLNKAKGKQEQIVEWTYLGARNKVYQTIAVTIGQLSIEER